MTLYEWFEKWMQKKTTVVNIWSGSKPFIRVKTYAFLFYRTTLLNFFWSTSNVDYCKTKRKKENKCDYMSDLKIECKIK